MGLEDAKTEVDRAFTGEGRGLAYENALGGATSFLRRRYTKDLTGPALATIGDPRDHAGGPRPRLRGRLRRRDLVPPPPLHQGPDRGRPRDPWCPLRPGRDPPPR